MPTPMPPPDPYPEWDEEEAEQLVIGIIDEKYDPVDDGVPFGVILVAAADEGMPPPLTEDVLARLEDDHRIVSPVPDYFITHW